MIQPMDTLALLAGAEQLAAATAKYKEARELLYREQIQLREVMERTSMLCVALEKRIPFIKELVRNISTEQIKDAEEGPEPWMSDEDVFAMVCHKLGVVPSEIRRKCRVTGMVQKRDAVILALHQYGWRDSRIDLALGRKHGATRNALRKAQTHE